MHIYCYSFRPIVSLSTIEILKYSNVDKTKINCTQYAKIDFWEFAVIR